MAEAARTPAGAMAAMALGLSQAWAVIREYRRGADLVHAHWWVPGGVSAWLARSLGGARYVVSLHGTDVALLERSAVARAVARRVLRRAEAVTAVSGYLAAAAGVLGLGRDEIVVQPMPADVERFERASRGGGGIATVGRLTEQKRIGVVIDAVARLRAAGTPLALTVIGDGPEREKLERQARDAGIAGETRFLGSLPPERIPEAVADADVFAFPAVREGFGLAAAEALMLGIPVAATVAGGGVTDIVPAHGGGRLVPEGNAVALADAIAELLMDPSSRRHALEAGAQLRVRLRPDIVARAFESIYERVLAGERVGRA